MERVGNQCSESSIQENPNQQNLKEDSHKDETEHQEDSRKEDSGEAQTGRKKKRTAWTQPIFETHEVHAAIDNKICSLLFVKQW